MSLNAFWKKALHLLSRWFDSTWRETLKTCHISWRSTYSAILSCICGLVFVIYCIQCSWRHFFCGFLFSFVEGVACFCLSCVCFMFVVVLFGRGEARTGQKAL